jgi:antitoxin component YwqK of YwqJK toxin-antitoxin module
MIRSCVVLAAFGILGACASRDFGTPIVSQQYIHKYGFKVSPQEWEAREGDGQIVELLGNGVKVVRSYENGVLHGVTSYTFPDSAVLEKTQVYDQGVLLKETVYDGTGMPIREDVYEFDNRVVTTCWDDKGAPLSIEETVDGLLSEAKYYTSEHELEARVESGFGERVKRERSGLLISRDTIQNGVATVRTTYHPSGEIHTVSHYDGDQLHGEQLKFNALGKPMMKLEWSHGVLDGTKVVFRNGSKVAEIPYVKGAKHGVEVHYDDLGNVVAEITWAHDVKHGCSKSLLEETVEMEWFYKGQSVSKDRFELLDNRDRVVAELRGVIE